MAIRKTKIDTTLSAIITNSSRFPPEASSPDKDEQRTQVYPLRIYEGYNYLPTFYGVKSYFGQDARLEIGNLPSHVIVEDLFTYQTKAYTNVLVALTSHGVYVLENTSWVLLYSMPAPPEGFNYQWTKATINNLLFMYRQGHSQVFCFDDLVDGVGVNMHVFNGMAVQPTRLDSSNLQIRLYGFAPTTLNMEGQVGIYKAGGSLGFWDTSDAIAWSAINDYTNFTPSLTTLANITKISNQVGRITALVSHGDGVLVYSTRSIVYMYESPESVLRYKTSVVLGNVGVAYPKEIVSIEPDTTHFAWTNMGLVQITNGDAKPIVPEVTDYLKETRTPQYLTMLNNRYLCIGVMQPDFINGNVELSTVTIKPQDWLYPGASVGGATIDGIYVDGSQVCFKNEATETEERGTKPHNIVPLLRAWIYEGANLVKSTHSSSTNPAIELFKVSKGNVRVPSGEMLYDLVVHDNALNQYADEQVLKFKDIQLAVYQQAYAGKVDMDARLPFGGWTANGTLLGTTFFTGFWHSNPAMAIPSGATPAPPHATIGVEWERDVYGSTLVEAFNRTYPEIRKTAWVVGSPVFEGYFIQPTTPLEEPQFIKMGNLEAFKYKSQVIGYPVYKQRIRAKVSESTLVGGTITPRVILDSPYSQPPHVRTVSVIKVYADDSTAVLARSIPYDKYTYFPQVYTKGSGNLVTVVNAPWNPTIPDLTAQAQAIVADQQSKEAQLQAALIDEAWADPAVVEVISYPPSAMDYTINYFTSPHPEYIFVYDTVEYDYYYVDLNIEDLTSLFYGEDLQDPTLKRINMMQSRPEELAGLVAIDEWAWTNNSSIYEKDASGLITAANREAVPLGYDIPRAKEDAGIDIMQLAAWSNRYFLRKFEVLDENGEPLDVPQGVVCGIVEPIDIPPLEVAPIIYDPWTIENPEFTWILQNGNKAPLNPTMYGCYVYDMHLGKWGVFKGEHKLLLDYQPVNTWSPGGVSYQNFMIDGGCLNLDYSISLFNDTPEDGYVRYGKYQHHGYDVTAIETIVCGFNARSSGLLTAQWSLDGRQLEYGLTNSITFDNTLTATLPCNKIGKWASITLTGHYDLVSMRIDSYGSGRR